MASYKYAFSLSKEEVRNAKPPGTVVLISSSFHLVSVDMKN